MRVLEDRREREQALRYWRSIMKKRKDWYFRKDRVPNLVERAEMRAIQERIDYLEQKNNINY